MAAKFFVELRSHQVARFEFDAPEGTSERELEQMALAALDASGGAQWEDDGSYTESGRTYAERVQADRDA